MRRGRVRALGAALILAASALSFPGAVQATDDPVTDRSTDVEVDQAVLPDPDAMLGADWSESSDVLVTGSGDQDGFHLYVAREKEAFAWETLATLNAGLHEVGTWTGNVCVTGSGRYAAVMYAPAAAVNRPKLMNEGGFAAIVDLKDGRVSRLPERVQLAYFNPACGPTDRVLLTRAIGIHQQRTDLIGVDAATGSVTGTKRIDAQLTNPVPAPDGDLGVVGGAVVKVGRSAQVTKVVRPGGQPFAVRATAGGAIDVLTVQGSGDSTDADGSGSDGRAVAFRYQDGDLTRLGDAPSTELQLFGLRGGRNLLVGDVSGLDAEGHADLATAQTNRNVRAVSSDGHLLVHSMRPEPVAEGRPENAYTQPQGGKGLKVTVRATATGRVSTGTVDTERLPAGDVDVVPSGGTDGSGTSGAVAPQDHGTSRPVAPGSRTCLVARNDIDIQVLQPSANQVEWAVDQAVHGRLAVQQNGMFPLPSGAPPVPAQLMLAILAQETNMYQGSWRGVPGDAVNPLISDYYGLRATSGGGLEAIDYLESDCGYGISQVTDGMGRNTSSRWNTQQQLAIATDYQANIAAGLQILIEKWDQLTDVNTYVNSRNPLYIENWYLAAWGYNSGVYPNDGGNYGVGYLNNPANPSYPPNRQPFLRASTEDASEPWKWPYQEKIMGWAETPQWQWIVPLIKYSEPNFGTASDDELSLPSTTQARQMFCGPVNNCNPDWPDPCPSWNSSCWWHGHVSWQSTAGEEFGTENLAYALGSSEPDLIPVFLPACDRFGGPSGTLIVEDLTDTRDNILCGGGAEPWGGKFTLRIGSPSGTVYSDYAEVDLHQIPGYLGHSWFTHTYDQETARPFGTDEHYRKVVGTWTPSITSQRRYSVVAHLPSRGTLTPRATYLISQNWGSFSTWECTIDQSPVDYTDNWISLGTYSLAPGARVQLDNIDYRSAVDVSEDDSIAYDAIAFVPVDNSTTHPCGTLY